MATNGFKVKNSINLQPGSAPANPLRGDIYCSSADGKFYRYDDSVPGWVELGSGGGAGATVTVSQTGHGFATDGSYIGKPIRNSGVANTYVLAKADTAENAEVVGIITAVADANSFSYSTGGEITGLSGLTPNTVSFLSGDTAGSTTTTAPTTVGYIEKPLLIATATNKAIFVNMRGSTVGGTNLYTTIPLNNGTATSLQTINVAAGEGGFIEGVIKIDATTDYVTTFKVEFARPLTGTAYTCTPQYGCDALPTGSSIDITSGGVIQLTLPSIAGFSSASARFSMQAANVGATLPLQIASSQITWSEPTMFRNRIINGGMAIDQRNAGASQNIAASSEPYTIDRFQVCNYFLTGNITAQRSTTAPTGFNYSLKVTNGTGEALVASDYGSIRQKIEGSSLFDLGFGTSSAKAITVSFWVRSSVAGNYTVGLINSAANRANRTVFSIAQVDTWERKTVSFLGDTTGTWATDSSIGMYLDIVLVAGSSQQDTPDTWTATVKEGASGACLNWVTSTNATFYITGVQLEPGTIATPFEFRPYGTELALCQRYYQSHSIFSLPAVSTGGGGTTLSTSYGLPVSMRSGMAIEAFTYTLISAGTSVAVGTPSLQGGGSVFATQITGTGVAGYNTSVSLISTVLKLTAEL